MILLAVGVWVLFRSRPAIVAQGHQVVIEGNRQHVANGEDMVYRNRPPSSGDHYPTPAGYGVFTREIPVANLVHSLEHGGIVVYAESLAPVAYRALTAGAYPSLCHAPSRSIDRRPNP